MYSLIGSDRKDVDLTPLNENGPSTVKFTFNREGAVNPCIDTRYMQMARRAILREYRSNGTEDKIQLIKYIRATWGTGLHEGKLIAEWFMANFPLHVGEPCHG